MLADGLGGKEASNRWQMASAEKIILVSCGMNDSVVWVPSWEEDISTMSVGVYWEGGTVGRSMPQRYQIVWRSMPPTGQRPSVNWRLIRGRLLLGFVLVMA